MGETRETTQQQAMDSFDIISCVSNASKVIVPLSPISVFAARSPWSKLEHKTFDEVAKGLKKARDVDMYPAVATILEAKKQGEIDEDVLTGLFTQWLEATNIVIPKAKAEQFGRNALKLEPLIATKAERHQLEALSSELSEAFIDNNESETITPLVSSYVLDKDNKKVIDTLDYHIIKWCKLYFDDAQSGWTMPNRERGLFSAWKRLVKHDPALTKSQRLRLKNLPSHPEALIKVVLSKLQINEEQTQTYLENHLLSLPGWAGMILWEEENNTHVDSLLLSYLAIRLGMEWSLVEPYLPVSQPDTRSSIQIEDCILSWLRWGGISLKEWSMLNSYEQKQYIMFATQFNQRECRKLWLEAWEATYNHQMKEMIVPQQVEQQQNEHTQVQMAFCIDVRSEPFRRQIEHAGPFETIGIAGFFGLPIEKCELGNHHSHPSLPIMNQPLHKIREYTLKREPTAFQQRKHTLESVTYTFKKMKQNALPSLLLPELSGPWLTLQMFSRSFMPKHAGHLMRKFYARWLHKPDDTTLTLNHKHHYEDGLPVGFTEEEKVTYTRDALRLMDLTSNFAPLVVFCGHGSHSANNPYAAALDCGACGGAASGFNAKVLAQLCNLPEVRYGLAQEGIVIPESTVFTAAEHMTSVDDLHWIYVPELNEAAQSSFEMIKAAMPAISYSANKKRLATLPHNTSSRKHPVSEVHNLTNDWSEVRPEWGLAKNAAFVIGQRELTKNSDLQGRVFLHNYDWQHDKDGSILATIISGPATVAQWINLQYYASTVAPHYYGSGSKATQTVTSGIGVMQGNASDLMTGLPWQSVMSSDNKMYHSPIRLLVVVQAPQQMVAQILEENQAFQQKVKNGWIRLASVDEFGQWQDW
ncbi:DUF2309 domain-containing protein [Staphylococcus succinus]|uniref:DUF2309 domain-containing protein n=1 Tax=Staphylococcus succinus TaxID=61015 RepID=UPI003F5BCE8E